MKVIWYNRWELGKREEVSFRKWKKLRSRQHFSGGIGLLAMIAMLLALVYAIPEPLSWEQILFVGIMIIAMAICGIHALKNAWGFKNAVVERFTYAQVYSKDRFSKNDRIRRYKNMAYFLTVQIGEEQEEAVCDMNTYKGVETGDEVIIFDTGDVKLYAVKG